MKQIEEMTRLSIARNAEHYQFHHDVLEVITETFATAQKIDSLRTNYKELFDREDISFAQPSALHGTAEVEAKNAAREELTRYVCMLIDAKQYSPVADEKAAAKRLRLKIDPYWMANYKPYAENTALVDNMVTDMLSSDYSIYTEILDLTKAVEQLKVLNDDFNVTYTKRSNEKESRSQSDKMKTIRPLVDEAYRKVVHAVNALYGANTLVAQDADMESVLAGVIDEVNALIHQLTQTIDIRLSRAATAKKKKSETES